MKLLIDGNIILDVLQKREPHFEDSSKIWKLCETGIAEGYLSPLTFANMVYVMRKELSPEKIEDVLNKLSFIFHFTCLGLSDLSDAAGMHWNDFEDAIQAASAKKLQVKYIITRNVKDFRNGQIPACTPTEFLMRL